jgi:hypothetical protein
VSGQVIRLVARRRRAIEQLDIAASHASVPNWEHDPARRDAVAFRLLLVARLARDGERPSDITADDWAWAQGLERFGGIVEPSRKDFRRVVEVELPEVRARLHATTEG